MRLSLLVGCRPLECLEQAVLEGSLLQNGMPRYSDIASPEAEAIRHYIRSQVPRMAEGAWAFALPMTAAAS